MTVRWTASARSQLQRLPQQQAQRIFLKVQWYAAQDEPLHFAVKLEGEHIGAYRFRVGPYRVFFDVDPAVLALVITGVRKRDQAYRS